ncbi:ADP-ribose pyrophosphatase YjhB, NUDIX family [Actinopolymorpha cephalotaxi]|uniref:ADP-ribose pyrophosphatase YjhB (NUDIX family) n=1 Tax=Actinopolymorpha cephalotaxi TaxID=504797 RepID=A0A1I2ZUS0_9ACTN|nr:NUDIX hydrolase [Actinopolymorpha cephalotaxi]NYH84166.1 ADP-ribose pyrophosphatase YjhB (NUDIX family) [Actinopolymorpha cephalotaxi]SFH41239.1 ADP-ribose pyrophosphatase YjhB, NUDIX family [Actinopolymorpha cephalotaxi]
MSVPDSSPEQYARTLPRKRMGAGVLLLDPDGRVLLVEPTYKDHWEVPGGVVEADESPNEAARRELKEELDLSQPLGRLLAVDWVPPQEGRTEGLMMIFDGGVVPPAVAAEISVPAEELRGWAFCSPQEAAVRLSPLLARRVSACVAARETGSVAYLEDGQLVT